MANQWIRLAMVPQLGGRLMQVTFGGHDYLFVNEQLKGKQFGPEVSATQKRWFNYGGDKIWPMPEGSLDEQHWAGAEGQVVDSGVFTAEVVSRDAVCTVRLVGPPDPQIGQQYTREISIDADSPVIRFHAVMKNISGYPQEWSEQSVSQYDTAAPGNPAQPNTDYWGFTPVNAQSVYLNSYHVRTGSASTPGYAVRDGLFTVHTTNAGGEVWIDSSAEWLAVVDGSTKYAMVEAFRYQRNMEYPGKATVIFFTTGNPARRASAESSRPQVFYMEAEINSPMVKLYPGESYAMDTQWYPARIGSNFRTATYAGVVGRQLSATSTPNGLTLAGEFGVFHPGRLEVRYHDARGLRLGTAAVQQVNPLELVTFEQTLEAPPETARVSLHVIDTHGVDRGPLGEVLVTVP